MTEERMIRIVFIGTKEMGLSIYEDAGNVADAILSLDKVIHGMRIWM